TALDDAALIAQAVRDVGVVLGATGAPAHASVVRWQRGVAQYVLGHGDRVRDATAIARSQRIALAGADYRGPGLNDLCADGGAAGAGWRGGRRGGRPRAAVPPAGAPPPRGGAGPRGPPRPPRRGGGGRPRPGGPPPMTRARRLRPTRRATSRPLRPPATSRS